MIRNKFVFWTYSFGKRSFQSAHSILICGTTCCMLWLDVSFIIFAFTVAFTTAGGRLFGGWWVWWGWWLLRLLSRSCTPCRCLLNEHFRLNCLEQISQSYLIALCSAVTCISWPPLDRNSLPHHLHGYIVSMLLWMVSTCLATVEALEKNLLQSSPKKKIENENVEYV